MVSREQFRAAEARFVREAIDSADGRRVLRTLEAQNIAGLDEIVSQTKSWSLLGLERPNNIVCSTVLIGFWPKAIKEYYARASVPSRQILAGIAIALAEHGDARYGG